MELDWIVISIINTEDKESKNEPKTPDKVFFGLILVSFFHLNILPNIYPPTSVDTHIIEIKSTQI